MHCFYVMSGADSTPNQRQYTWSRVNPSRANGYSRARLDRFYVSLGYIPSVQSCNISLCCLSDHSAVNLKLKVNHTHSNGSAYWHFNNHLLSDETYTSTIHHFWVNWRMEKINFPTLYSWWNFGKKANQEHNSNVQHQKSKRKTNCFKLHQYQNS